MPKITSCPPSPIRNLPPEIMRIILEKIHENEKADDHELSHSMDLRHLGEAFIPDFVRKPDSVKNPYTQQKATPREIYNILILKLVSNTNFPLELFNSLLDYFVEEKCLDLEAALTLPSAQKRKDLELHIIQRTDLMIRALKEEVHFEKLQENIQAFPFENIQNFPLECIGFGKTLCENLSNIPAHLQEFFLKEGNKLIGHTEGYELLDASSKADGAPELKRIINALHADYLGNFISRLIKKQPDRLNSLEYFQALTCRLQDVSNKDLPLLLELVRNDVMGLVSLNPLHEQFFDALVQKFDDFPESMHGQLLVELASMIQYLKSGRIETIQWFAAQIDVLTDDANKMSILKVLAEQTSQRCSFYARGNDQLALMEIIEKNLLNIPIDQIGGILGRLAESTNGAWTADMQLRILNLLGNYLPIIPDSQIRLALEGFSYSGMDFQSAEMQERAFSLVNRYLPKIPSNQIGGILCGLAQHMRWLSTETLRQDSFNLIKDNLANIPNSQLGEVLEGVALNLWHFESEAIQLHAFNFLEENLKQAIELNILTEKQHSEILKQFSNIFGYIAPEDAPRIFFEQIKPNIFSLLEKGMPHLSNKNLSSVLIEFFDLDILDYKEEELSRIFSLTENHIDRLPASKFEDVHEAYADVKAVVNGYSLHTGS